MQDGQPRALPVWATAELLLVLPDGLRLGIHLSWPAAQLRRLAQDKKKETNRRKNISSCRALDSCQLDSYTTKERDQERLALALRPGHVGPDLSLEASE